MLQSEPMYKAFKLSHLSFHKVQMKMHMELLSAKDTGYNQLSKNKKIL